ncbi:DUF2189 domain-containing protein [Thiohalomonas denitrificans]|uniref:DUF2189 domain-containing protein n=1 Tax=Thiohalomonas denitrificans TaxID=415747 RepID=UPI0026F210DB|nr:DUF2189 domain-containing protein [Thiohalomonas denitrificans]
MPRPVIHHVSPVSMPSINPVDFGAPLRWLRAGWDDLKHNPATSIGYGLFIIALYAVIIAFALGTNWYHVGLQLTAGFTLLAPVFAVGFYRMSQRMEEGSPIGLADAFGAWNANPRGILGMGVVLLLLLLSWFMVGMWTTAFLLEGKAELVLRFGEGGLGDYITALPAPLIIAFFLTGLVAGLVAFCFSAVSIPLLMEEPDLDFISALVTSWNAVIRNIGPMLWWALLIGMIFAGGLLLGYIGLAVALPWLGHATWHAYREVVNREVSVSEVHEA